MYPTYLRGEAYLKLGRGHEAAAEFQKILDHRGVVVNFVIGSLAQLQLARAAAMSGDTASARKHYEDFLGLWKGADADLPVLSRRPSRVQTSELAVVIRSYDAWRPAINLRREVGGDVQNQLGYASGVGVDFAVYVGQDRHVRCDPAVDSIQC